jgi:Tol biopolymer transport system component
MIGHFGWTPDSKAVVAIIGADILTFDAASTGTPRKIFSADNASSFAYADAFTNNLSDFFRPPNGDEILFVGKGPDGMGVYRQSLAGGAPIAVVTDQGIDSTWTENQSGVQWSPDGARIVLTIHPAATPEFGYAYVVNADGTNLRRLTKYEVSSAVVDEEHTSWSPDGTRIALARWIMYDDGNIDPRPVVIVDVATGHEVEATNREVNGYNGWSWSPDGSMILEVPGDGSDDAAKVMQVDAGTGQAHELGWTSPNAATWQRTVPKH